MAAGTDQPKTGAIRKRLGITGHGDAAILIGTAQTIGQPENEARRQGRGREAVGNVLLVWYPRFFPSFEPWFAPPGSNWGAPPAGPPYAAGGGRFLIPIF